MKRLDMAKNPNALTQLGKKTAIPASPENARLESLKNPNPATACLITW